jgi:hypothetical protein
VLLEHQVKEILVVQTLAAHNMLAQVVVVLVLPQHLVLLVMVV